jgi:hypothetical protein
MYINFDDVSNRTIVSTMADTQMDKMIERFLETEVKTTTTTTITIIIIIIIIIIINDSNYI